MTEQAPPSPPAPKTVGRFGCISTAIIFIIMAILPFYICRFIDQGQLEFGEAGSNQTRIFLLQDPGQEGIGVQRSIIRDESAMCVETSISYWMIAGEGENNRDCVCMNEISASDLPDGCTAP